MDLTKLLRPKKIAIVGATEKETMAGFACRMFIEQCKNRLSDLYLVALKNETVYGIKCYRKLEELPEDIDLAVLCTPKSAVMGLLEEAADKGAKAAVVFASGYGETGKPEDIALESELVSRAKALDIAVMGPNCAGFLNFIDRVFSFGFLFQAREAPGKVGLVSQSGQVCMGLMESAKASFSYVISSGNSKVVTIEDYFDFLVDDDSTAVVAAYVEGIRNPQKFTEVLKKAAQKQKPVVILKAGRSQKGSRAAASHTGNLSGSDKNIDALFQKFGVIRVDDLEELLSVSAAITTLKNLPKRNALAFVNISGGETTISADAGSLCGLELPDFGEDTVKKLKAVLPPFATAQNPMDLTGGSNGDTFEQVARIVLDDPDIEMLVTSLQITEKISDVTIYDFLDGLIRYCEKGNGKPVAVVPLIESSREQEVLERLREVGVPILPPPNYGYKVIKKLMDYSAFLETLDSRTLSIACPKEPRGKGRVALSEHASKEFFKSYGIPCPEEAVAPTMEEAVAAANSIGYPVVMKIESPDILHKSEAGGVKLNIKDDAAVRKSFQIILQNAKAYAPGANINGVLVQHMLPSGLEAIVGANCDPQLGPMVLFGLGGIFTEVFRDAALYPAPFNKGEAMKMIASIKGGKLLQGYRGKPKLDVDALADALVSVSRLAVENKDRLLEMDINPLFVYPEGEGVAAADGLIVLSRGE